MSPWHWLYLSGQQAVSLYAVPLAGHSEAELQWVLPGFGHFFETSREAMAMKGLWDKSRAVNAEYRPALDALRAVDPTILVAAIHAALEHGCALMLGATRDHGAISLTLLDGNDRHRVYPSNVQELQQALEDLVASLSTTATTPPPERKRR